MRLPSARWRFLLVVVGMLAVLAAFAACGGGKEAGKTPTAGKTPAANLAADQTLRVRLAGEPQTLDPQVTGFDVDISLIKQLYRGLFYYNGPEMKVVPAVAKKMPAKGDGISDDGLTYTFELRDNATWSDGTPVTAKDFVYALQRLFDPKIGATGYYFSFYEAIVGAEAAAKGEAPTANIGVKAINDTTLEIKLSQPLPTLLTLLAMWPAYPVRQDIIEAKGDAWTEAGNLIGNGPFVLKEWAHDDHITMDANPTYWGDDKPTLQTLVFKMIPDEAAALIAYQNGELDLTAIPLPDTKDFEGKPEQAKNPELSTFAWEFNNTKPPFDNANVRKAFSAATDRDTYIQSVRGGVGIPTTSWLPPGLPGYDPNRGKDYAFNPVAAKKFLSDAGFPNGQGLPKVTLTVADSQGNRLSSEFLKQQIKQNLGVDIDIEILESATYETRYKSSDFQVALGGWGADYADPENWLPKLFGTDASANQYKYSNPKADLLFKQSASELDNDKRIKLYQEAEKVIIDEDMGVAPIFHRVRNWLKKTYVDGLAQTGLDGNVPGDFFYTRVRILQH
ncbi:MAG TPA: peptide ABC transporter substrate-binding protein [Dehalococcoidia bacterium]|nr:peptide ABC transporter substrate-binding protein [Dehalococcoidia bacterium]